MTKNANLEETIFGIEIELTVSTAKANELNLQIGPYHHGIQVPFLPEGWTAERDGSIHTSFARTGVEIVSPKLHGAAGIQEVLDVVKILHQHGFRPNRSTGVHVSVFWDRNNSSVLLSKLISCSAYCEKGIYAVTGTKSRERGQYCCGIQKYGNPKNAKKEMDRSRYTLLNLTNLQRGCDRVEFRAFSGSLDQVKIAGWIQLCLGIVGRALETKRLPLWSPKPATGGWKKKGPGASECERLFGFLGWGKGYAKLKGGKSHGWLTNTVSQDAVKKEFRRLAKKYDTEV